MTLTVITMFGTKAIAEVTGPGLNMFEDVAHAALDLIEKGTATQVDYLFQHVLVQVTGTTDVKELRAAFDAAYTSTETHPRIGPCEPRGENHS